MRLTALRNAIITKIKDIDVLCHECFSSTLTFAEMKDVSFVPVKRWHNWVGKRFDSAWFMLTFGVEAEDRDAEYGIYLDLDGDGVVYDDNGTILGAINNAKYREDREGVTRGARWIPLSVSNGDHVTLYVEMVHNDPKRPLSFPAFFKRAYFGTYRSDIYELYYECSMRSADSVKSVLDVLNTLDRDSVSKALHTIREESITREEDILLSNSIEYGHLRPIRLHPTLEMHEYVKVLRALDMYADIRYLSGCAYDIFSIRDKALRHRITEYIKAGRIIVPTNLTDADACVLSGESIVRNIKIGYDMMRDIYGVESHMVSLRSHTLPMQLARILKSAEIDTLYTDRLESGTLEGIRLINRDTATLPLCEKNVETAHRRGMNNQEGNATYEGEIVKAHTEGAYTTMGRLKLYNRQIEQAMHNLEYLATYSYLTGNEYPEKKIDAIYRVSMKYASYNALAGNNTREVNDALRVSYIALGKDIEQLRDEIMSTLKDAKNTRCVINASPYQRDEWFKVGSDWYKTKAEPYSITKVVRGAQPDDNVLTYTANSIENDILRVTFNKYGEIVSLLDKRDMSESIGGASLRYYMYYDPKRHDNAINMKDNYHTGIKATFKFRKHKVFIDGATIIWQNQYRFRRNAIVENIVLSEGADYVRVDSRVKWEDVNTMLRVEVIPKDKIASFRTDTQFGTVVRASNNSRAHHGEFPISKWIMTGEDKGLGITMDAKYGARVEDSLVSIALLRSTRYPDNSADIGTHYFTMTLQPNTTPSTLNALAYNIVSPIIVEENTVDFTSLISSDDPSIVIETVKKGRGDRSIVARLYDLDGKGGRAHISTLFSYYAICETNVLETSRIPLESADIEIEPCGIKTIVFEGVRLD